MLDLSGPHISQRACLGPIRTPIPPPPRPQPKGGARGSLLILKLACVFSLMLQFINESIVLNNNLGLLMFAFFTFEKYSFVFFKFPCSF